MNTPTDLNSILFAQLNRLSNPNLKGGELEAKIQKAEAIENINKQENSIDQFIESGGFDKAFLDVFGLPASVVESLKEVS